MDSLRRNENDVLIEGYSDQLLRFIAERGDEGQLGHVERLDQAYELVDNPPGLAAKSGGNLRKVSPAANQGESSPEAPLSVASLTPRFVFNGCTKMGVLAKG